MTTLPEAAEHARGGRYDTARTLLAPLTRLDSTDVDALDLLARIHAQEGDLIAADTAWRRVLVLDPDHKAARAGRSRIHTTWSSTPLHRGIPRPIGVAVAAVALVGAGATTYWLGGLGADPGSSGNPDITALEKQTSTISDEVDELAAASQKEEQEPAAAARLEKSLEDPRWKVRTAEGHTTLIFHKPVFESGSAVLSAGGAAVLGAVAEELRGLADGSVVTVTGHAGAPASGGAPTGNHSATLGLARALAAADTLTGHGLADDLVRTRTAGDLDTPYPATDDRNQTVTVEVTLPEEEHHD